MMFLLSTHATQSNSPLPIRKKACFHHQDYLHCDCMRFCTKKSLLTSNLPSDHWQMAHHVCSKA